MDQFTSPFMTADQTAAYLQIHIVSLYRLATEKKLPCRRLGKRGKLLFDKAELDRFLFESGKIFMQSRVHPPFDAPMSQILCGEKPSDLTCANRSNVWSNE